MYQAYFSRVSMVKCLVRPVINAQFQLAQICRLLHSVSVQNECCQLLSS